MARFQLCKGVRTPFEAGLQHGGRHGCRLHGVHPDTPSKVDSHRAGHAAKRSLAGRIGHEIRLGQSGVDAADVHHATACCFQLWQQGLRTKKWRHDVDIERRLPVLSCQGAHATQPLNSCVVDEGMQASPLQYLTNTRHNLIGIVRVGYRFTQVSPHIGCDRQTCRRRNAVDTDHKVAGSGESCCNGLANAASNAGHHATKRLPVAK